MKVKISLIVIASMACIACNTSKNVDVAKTPAPAVTTSSTPSQQEVASDDSSTAFSKTLELQGHKFVIECPNSSSLNQLAITPTGLTDVTEQVRAEVDGSVTGAEIADLDGNGYPEIYIYLRNAGSGAYGDVVALASNNGKSLSDIYLPPVSENKEASLGYQGHDEFTIIENTFARRFPVYKEGDDNATPTGGYRQMEYKLKPGEASWQLVLKKTQEIEKE